MPFCVRVSLFIYFITALLQMVLISLVKGQLQFSQGHFPARQSLLHQLDILVLQRRIRRLQANHLRDSALNYQFGTPQAGHL